jgi:hypothetical protein
MFFFLINQLYYDQSLPSIILNNLQRDTLL